MSSGVVTATVAWVVTSCFYFLQYAMRSAPAVMMPQLSDGFAMSTGAVAGLVGLFYYGYSPFSLVAGVAMDQLGPRRVVPLGAATVGIGALLFSTGDPMLAAAGRFLQGAGGVFALIGAAYLTATSFPASRAGTLIGATQMFGMAGGSAGQFLVGPAIAGGLPWDRFWAITGVAALAIAVLLWLVLPARGPKQNAAQETTPETHWAREAGRAVAAVFANPQSWLCGLIAGLMFLPTTIFDMVWGVRFLQEGYAVDYGEAVMRSAAVPLGWMIGCPLLGWVSDRVGRRKPVIIGAAIVLLVAMATILFGPAGRFPPYVLAVVLGIASGAAMIPYTVIKEANRPEHSGTATGVINFLNFSLSALLGPLFGLLLVRVSAGETRALADYQVTFEPLVWGVGLAVLLAFFLKETGPATRTAR